VIQHESQTERGLIVYRTPGADAPSIVGDVTPMPIVVVVVVVVVVVIVVVVVVVVVIIFGIFADGVVP